MKTRKKSSVTIAERQKILGESSVTITERQKILGLTHVGLGLIIFSIGLNYSR